MTFLSFSPAEHDAITHAGKALNLGRKPLPALQRLLAQALADEMPDLAARVATLSRDGLGILRDHFREQCQSPAGHGLTNGEVEQLAEAAGPTPFRTRIIGPLRRALVQFFGERAPALAAHLGRLSDAQFEALCQQVQARTRKGV